MSTSPGFATRVKLLWRTFRVWRTHRPFWAGVFTLLSGSIIIGPPYASLQIGDIVISISTVGGVSALLIGAIMSICGCSLWLRPQFRFTSGVVTMLLALVALVAVNLGSFLIGTILGLIGGGLAIAWAPHGTPSASADGGQGAAPHGRSQALSPPSAPGQGERLSDERFESDGPAEQLRPRKEASGRSR